MTPNIIQQSDRDAAAAMWFATEAATNEAFSIGRGIRDGEGDDHPIVQSFASYRLQIMEEAAKDLNARANVLRTPAGWIAAEWHEHDAAMVANELDRIAKDFRTNHRANEGGGDD